LALSPDNTTHVASQQPEDQLRQLRHFLAWLLPTAVGVAALLLLIVQFYPSRDLTIASIAVGCYSLLLVWGRAQLARGKVARTVAAVCSGLFMLALAVTSTSPSAAPVLVLLPFMAITVALPYVGTHALRWLSLIGWLIAVTVTFLAVLDREGTIPELVLDGIPPIIGVAVESGLILLLLWQFSSRLNTILAQTRAANRALLAVNAQLESQHERLRQEQEALQRSEEQFRLTFEIAPIGMAIVAVDGRFLRVNQALCNTTGYTAQELLRRTFADLIDPGDLAAQQALDRQLLNGQMPFIQTERRYLGKDGQVIETLLHIALVRDSQGHPLHFTAQIVDLTERKQAELQRLALERRLLEAQKLESIGMLAGGIAHDFNNLLVGILGNTSLLLTELPPSSQLHERVLRIETAAARAAELTQQMLAYAGKGRFVVEPIDLNTLIAEMPQLLSASISKNATLQHQLTPKLPIIEGDVTQLRQLIMNLIINASEAIGDQPGTISISTSLRHIELADQATEHDADLPVGDYVVLDVADTGCGMDAATLARIFDPFFTTKFTGRGLGLAAVQGIVRSHHGTLRVASAYGHGTTFSILLPCAVAPVDQPQTADSSAAIEALEGDVVLVIDDEPDVRLVAEQMLVYAGFEVLLASSGATGIELFRERADTIGCVLLDLTMPIMDGEEVFHALQAIRPTIPIILMSGYSEQEVRRRFDGPAPAGFIQKPFTFKALQAKVQRAVAAGSQP
jgi:PAS domain S-box-containing protein